MFQQEYLDSHEKKHTEFFQLLPFVWCEILIVFHSNRTFSYEAQFCMWKWTYSVWFLFGMTWHRTSCNLMIIIKEKNWTSSKVLILIIYKTKMIKCYARLMVFAGILHETNTLKAIKTCNCNYGFVYTTSMSM